MDKKQWLLESENSNKKKLGLVETWSSENKFNLTEANDEEKLKKGILGKVIGQFFVPNGASRNGRYYTLEFWQKVIERPEIKKRLKEGLMGGQIGHKEYPVSDEDWNKGEVSHKIVRLWIEQDENGVYKGMAEAHIFDTPSGRNLFTYLASGTQLYTSSRASGDYIQGEQVNGLPVVDESTYYLDTWDFVKDAGFLEAQPSLLENKGEKGMTLEEQIKKLQEDLTIIKNSLSKNENNQPDNKLATLTESFETVKTQFENHKKETSFVSGLSEDCKKTLQSLSSDEVFEALTKTVCVVGEPKKVSYNHQNIQVEGVFVPTKQKPQLSRVHKALANEDLEYPQHVLLFDKNETFGCGFGLFYMKDLPENIVEKTKDLIANNSGVVFEGYGADINSASKLLKEYKKLGTIEKLTSGLSETKKLLDEHKKYVEIGTPEEIKALLENLGKLLPKLESLGKNTTYISKGIEKAKSVFENYKKEKAKANRLKLEAHAKNLSTKFEIPVSKCFEAIKDMGLPKATKFLEGLKVENNRPNNDNNKDKGTTKKGDGSLLSKIAESYVLKGGK